jgi:hypothetical protein
LKSTPYWYVAAGGAIQKQVDELEVSLASLYSAFNSLARRLAEEAEYTKRN